jgi:Fe-S cluster biogenesis protein NfuA
VTPFDISAWKGYLDLLHFPKNSEDITGESPAMKEKVQKALDQVRPMLQQDGGDVELVDIDEETGVVNVRLTGACKGCPMSQMTLKAGIERYLKSEIPEVSSVESVD